MAILFYVGLHQPADAQHFPRACISVNRLRSRRKPVHVGRRAEGGLLLDSAAFTEISRHAGIGTALPTMLRRSNGSQPS